MYIRTTYSDYTNRVINGKTPYPIPINIINQPIVIILLCLRCTGRVIQQNICMVGGLELPFHLFAVSRSARTTI